MSSSTTSMVNSIIIIITQSTINLGTMLKVKLTNMKSPRLHLTIIINTITIIIINMTNTTNEVLTRVGATKSRNKLLSKLSNLNNNQPVWYLWIWSQMNSNLLQKLRLNITQQLRSSSPLRSHKLSRALSLNINRWIMYILRNPYKNFILKTADELWLNSKINHSLLSHRQSSNRRSSSSNSTWCLSSLSPKDNNNDEY